MPTTIMIIRHAEKPLKSDDARGVDTDGANDKHSLTVTGWARAGALVELLASHRNPPPAGLRRPDGLVASEGGGSNSTRPAETLVPLAAKLGLEVDTTFSRGQEAELVAALAGRAGAVLVAWQHESISDIVAHLGAVTPAPPVGWPDSRYDVVWVFEGGSGKWTFRQVPQLLLAGDSAEPL